MVKIDPLIYQKTTKHKQTEGYSSACCEPHRLGEIERDDECDHTSPWEN